MEGQEPNFKKPTQSSTWEVLIITTFIGVIFLAGSYFWQEWRFARQIDAMTEQWVQYVVELREENSDLEKKIEEVEETIGKNSNWQTYTNAEGGDFRFKYPTSFSLKEDNAEGRLFSNDDGYFWVYIYDNVKNLETTQEIMDDYYANDSYGYKYEDNLTKIEGIHVYKQGRYDLGVIEKYHFLVPGKIIQFNFEFNFDNADEELQKEKQDLIAAILATLIVPLN